MIYYHRDEMQNQSYRAGDGIASILGLHTFKDENTVDQREPGLSRPCYLWSKFNWTQLFCEQNFLSCLIYFLDFQSHFFFQVQVSSSIPIW